MFFSSMMSFNKAYMSNSPSFITTHSTLNSSKLNNRSYYFSSSADSLSFYSDSSVPIFSTFYSSSFLVVLQLPFFGGFSLDWSGWPKKALTIYFKLWPYGTDASFWSIDFWLMDTNTDFGRMMSWIFGVKKLFFIPDIFLIIFISRYVCLAI